MLSKGVLPMLMLPAAPETSATHRQVTAIVFTEDEQHRLRCLQVTVAAERWLVPPDQPCPDHRACRRLAFARWLHISHRLSDGSER